MSVVYDGSHSITFYDGEETKNTWTDWHLIPTSRPFVNPAQPAVSIIEIPGSTKTIDMTESLGSVSFGIRTGEWEFYIDNNQWDDWVDVYSTIIQFVNGKRLTCVLCDDFSTAYTGRFSFASWKNGDSYSTVSIQYNIELAVLENTMSGLTLKLNSNSFLSGVYENYSTGLSVLTDDYTETLNQSSGIATVSKNGFSKKYIPGLVDFEAVIDPNSKVGMSTGYSPLTTKFSSNDYYINQIYYDGTTKAVPYQSDIIGFSGFLTKYPTSAITIKYPVGITNEVMNKSYDIPMNHSYIYVGTELDSIPSTAIGPIMCVNETITGTTYFPPTSGYDQDFVKYYYVADSSLLEDIENGKEYYPLLKIYDDCQVDYTFFWWYGITGIYYEMHGSGLYLFDGSYSKQKLQRVTYPSTGNYVRLVKNMQFYKHSTVSSCLLHFDVYLIPIEE